MGHPGALTSEAVEVEACDVLVVGGGPAGSAAAIRLAQQGRRVVLVEKSQHPRFHIGESLLPASVPLLAELGVRDRIEAIGMAKWGVEFVSQQHAHTSQIEFAEAWDASLAGAWQVRRSAFDQILFQRAGEVGAVTLQGCRVTRVSFDAQGADVEACLDDGAIKRWRASFVIDASGRDTLLANQLGCKSRNLRHNSAAIFGHFSGAKRLPGKLEGHISIFWFQHGWIWFIPLADGTTSVGATCWPGYLKTRDKALEHFFFDTLALAPGLMARLEGAQLVEGRVHATGNYSYASRVCQGERWLMVGDAYAFIDPVFSSGVHLALSSAFESARVVEAFFDRPAELPAARKRFDAVIARGPAEFSWFIFRMTNPAIRELFMNPRNPLGMKRAVMSLLAGDIYRRRPYWLSLQLFKGVYWINSLLHAPRSWRAWRARQRLVSDAGALRGETVMVEPR